MSKLNQEAPPAEAAQVDFLKLPPFPKSDTLVLTVVAFSYNEKTRFDRTDDSGKEYVEYRPGLEFYFGALVDGKPYFVKPWPVAYSLHEKSNYAKWYKAATDKTAEPGTNPADMVGKFVLGTVEVQDKKGKKGTAYTITKLANVTKAPSILANTGAPLPALLPALNALLEAADSKAKPEASSNPY